MGLIQKKKIPTKKQQQTNSKTNTDRLLKTQPLGKRSSLSINLNKNNLENISTARKK